MNKLKVTPSSCHVAVEEALGCCLKAGDLMAMENEHLLCSTSLEND